MNILFIVLVLTVVIIGIYAINMVLSSNPSQGASASASASANATASPVCGTNMKNVNGVCVPEIRYLSGFDYADCDNKYVWSKDFKAYVNEKQDRALMVDGKKLSCFPIENGKVSTGTFGTRVIDVEVLFGEHSQTDIPVGTERTLTGFGYANCDGHYRWSSDMNAFINDEGNRAITLDGPRLVCYEIQNHTMGGTYGTRVIGANGVDWK